MNINYVGILDCGPIKKSMIGKEYRHVTMQDLKNQKTADYVIFRERHQFMWMDTLKENLPDIAYHGEITSISITQELIQNLKSPFPLSIKEGEIVDIIIWYWDSWSQLPEGERVLRSLQDQVWRFRSFPMKQRNTLQESDLDVETQFEGTNDWERDYFDAMTDGMLGDYDDFKGDIDDIQTWSRG